LGITSACTLGCDNYFRNLSKDGKMAQENNFGRAVYLKQGQAYETTDGQKIIANSNEVARLDSLIQQGHKSR